jgi:hypothetical protein
VPVPQLEVDFRREWFFPDDSYVNNFINFNNKYYASGTSFMIYTKAADYSTTAHQNELLALHGYLHSSDHVDHTEQVTNWHDSFITYCETSGNTWGGNFSPSTDLFATKASFYSALTSFYRSDFGARFRTSITWSDASCGDAATWASCNPGAPCQLSHSLQGSPFSLQSSGA